MLGDLNAYNIHVTPQDTATFFGISALPEPQVPAEILNTLEANNMVNDEHARLIHLLDATMVTIPPSQVPDDSEESAVDDFVVELFWLLGYIGHQKYARTRKELPLFEIRHAKTDVCIIDSSYNCILLIVQENKCSSGQLPGTFADTEAQLIGNAIAAFVYNNKRRRDTGLPELQEKVSTSSHYFACLLTTSAGYGWNHHDRNYPNILQSSCHNESGF